MNARDRRGRLICPGENSTIEPVITAQYEVDPAIASAWKAEIDRRIEDFELGRIKGVPLEESLARARKIVGL
jgi:hypothetical protein